MPERGQDDPFVGVQCCGCSSWWQIYSLKLLQGFSLHSVRLMSLHERSAAMICGV